MHQPDGTVEVLREMVIRLTAERDAALDRLAECRAALSHCRAQFHEDGFGYRVAKLGPQDVEIIEAALTSTLVPVDDPLYPLRVSAYQKLKDVAKRNLACGSELPGVGYRCDLPQGHAGMHQMATFGWEG